MDSKTKTNMRKTSPYEKFRTIKNSKERRMV